MQFLKLPYCEECGEVRVPHALYRYIRPPETVAIRSFPLVRQFIELTEAVERSLERTLTPERTLTIMGTLSRVGLTSLSTEVTPKDNTRTEALYEGALPAGVTLYSARVLGIPVCFIGEKEVGGEVRRVLFHIIPRPQGFVSPSLSWMDDKGLLKEKLMEAHLPCAAGGVASSEDEAVALFHKIGRPVIAKPYSGSRGRHTTLDIRDEAGVREGFRIAEQLMPKVVIEAYLKGTVHRVTLVGGVPVAVARREYPHVIGDGVHSVLELVEAENAQPYRNGTHFRKIDIRHRADAALKKQNLTFDAIPEVGRMVILNDKNSRLHGTITEDVTDTVHPENIELFTRLGSMLGDPIVGVDFMIGYMARSWKEQPDAGVIECNSMPFIDVHHRVVSGKTIDVAEHLWNAVFSDRYRSF
jgi:D-alanine-D-alanine ligase-like ATP-grasp enzyme